MADEDGGHAKDDEDMEGSVKRGEDGFQLFCPCAKYRLMHYAF